MKMTPNAEVIQWTKFLSNCHLDFLTKQKLPSNVAKAIEAEISKRISNGNFHFKQEWENYQGSNYSKSQDFYTKTIRPV